MKRFLIIVLAVAMPHMIFAQYEASKKVTRSYIVTGNGSLEIIGKYGDIHIDTWDSKTVELKVEIEVQKRSEKQAKEMLEKVTIAIEDSNKEALSFRTNIDGSFNNKSGERLKIKYWIKAPKSLAYRIKNSYGNFYIDDNTGKNDFKIAYGNIKAEKCSGETNLKLSYGNGEVEEIGEGDLVISYSNITFGDIKNTSIENNYSNLDAENLGSVIIENRYGNFKAKSLISIGGSSKYGNVSIGKLYKEIDFGGGIKVNWISKDFEKINIEAKYESIELKFEKGFGASIVADMSYCTLKLGNIPFDYSQIREKAQKSYYKGVIGDKAAAGNRTITIESAYGNAKLRYAD